MMSKPYIDSVFICRSLKLLLAFMLFITNGYAQEKLSLKDALAAALERSFSLQMARTAYDQASERNHPGEAGMLPRVDVQGGVNRTSLDLNQKLADGRIIERNGAASTFYTGGAVLSWTLFDGLTMFARRDQLAGREEESRLSLRLQMEETVEAVISAYYSVRVQEETISALDELLRVDSIRLYLSQTRLESGSGARPEYLQAAIERNTHLAQKTDLLLALESSRENLNLLMGRDPSFSFITTDSLVLVALPEDTLQDEQRRNWLPLRLALQQEQNTRFEQKALRGARLPSLVLDAGYNYNRTINEAGFLLRNQNQGPGIGLTLRWNLFNGFSASRQIQLSELGLQLAQRRIEEEQRLQLQAERQALREYRLRKEQALLGAESFTLSEENLAISVERFRAGRSTVLELQEAQRSYRDAAARYASDAFRAKQGEISLLRLRGELVK
jgi:outer membrane protein TolC